MLAIGPTFDGRRTIPSKECTDLIADMLQLSKSDKLLEIGTGSGTQTCAWATSGAEIHSIELEPFVDPTVVTGECVFLHHGDGVKGIPSEAPFSAIVATCGVKDVPKAWIEQLADGGKLVAPVGDVLCQRLTLFMKHERELIPVRVAAYVRFQMLRENAA